MRRTGLRYGEEPAGASTCLPSRRPRRRRAKGAGGCWTRHRDRLLGRAGAHATAWQLTVVAMSRPNCPSGARRPRERPGQSRNRGSGKASGNLFVAAAQGLVAVTAWNGTLGARSQQPRGLSSYNVACGQLFRSRSKRRFSIRKAEQSPERCKATVTTKSSGFGKASTSKSTSLRARVRKRRVRILRSSLRRCCQTQ